MDDVRTTYRRPAVDHDEGFVATNADGTRLHAKRLPHNLEKLVDGAADRRDSTERREPPRTKLTARRVFKFIAGTSAVAVFGWMPAKALWQTSSVEAVVNARLVTLRAPIDGQVQIVAGQARVDNGQLAESVNSDAVILRIVNPRGDRSRLDDLRRQLARLVNERPSIEARLAAAQSTQSDLSRRVQQFQDGRIHQLEARVAEIETSVEAAASARQDASAAVERASTLVQSGTISTVELSRLTKNQTIAQQTEIGLKRKLDAAQIELAAAKQGTYIGDSYSDTAVQREEEMRLRISDLQAGLKQTNAEISSLESEVGAEEQRYVRRTSADITAPVSGRVWEMMTSSGEDVRAGEPLLKLLDCSTIVVTANVTEKVYNGLQLGQHALFEPNDGRQALQGTVINLAGNGDAKANLAINPEALNKEPYHVTLAVSGGDMPSKECTVGRTGRVVFESAAVVR